MSGVDFGRISILLVDHHPIVRLGLRFVLEQDGRFGVIGEAGNGREATRLVDALRPDVVVMDGNLPDVDGLALAREIKRIRPATRLMVVAAGGGETDILGLLEAGVDGYLLKQCQPEELRDGVGRVHAGERVLHQSIVRVLVARAVNRVPVPTIEALSEREQEVLRLLADGATSKEIAVALGLRPKTVENHRARILGKLGVTNSAAAVRAALANGLLGSGAQAGGDRLFGAAF
ncbi:MAG: hypothetical protein AVDCRST_MAG73-1547 [uncultured Thermomicrobiales bacterium]|uniref:Two-component transcriptional response regulator, LuxR family n=1 Tax=uncultured Thermomicrobiales bacterium TaxID=1645740 RepID=A0A6J4U0L1_9BACT|nr:MAG: hypothetical protein AVDCRST_MAG73-1547 [uncultured Thermomicrobiales bacterium]